MIGDRRTKPNSVSDLIARFYKSRVYKGGSDSTKTTNRALIEKGREEYGTYSVATLKKHNIDAMMAAKSDTPAATNNFLKRINQVLDLAVDLKMAASNEARKVKFFEYESEGIYTWSEGDIAAYFKHHAPGSVAHDATSLMLYTAAAKVDAVQMGRFSLKQTDSEPRLIYRRQKMRNRKPMRVSINTWFRFAISFR